MKTQLKLRGINEERKSGWIQYLIAEPDLLRFLSKKSQIRITRKASCMIEREDISNKAKKQFLKLLNERKFPRKKYPKDLIYSDQGKRGGNHAR